MGFESTLAAINNTPLLEEFKALKKAMPEPNQQNVQNDPPLFEKRIPLINAHVNLVAVFQKYGLKDNYYNIACLDLLLEYFYARQHSLHFNIKNNSVEISRIERERLARIIFSKTTKINLNHFIASKKSPAYSLHEAAIIRMHARMHQEYLKSVIESLWEYKKELLDDHRPNTTSANSAELLAILEEDKITKNPNFVISVSALKESLSDSANDLLSFEQDIVYQNKISTLEERLAFNREIMEYRISLCIDLSNNYKDPESDNNEQEEAICNAHNLTLCAELKTHLEAVVKDLKLYDDHPDLNYPKAQPSMLSETSIACGKKLFATARTPKSRSLKSVKDLLAFSETLFDDCHPTLFTSSSIKNIKQGFQTLAETLKKDLEAHPALCSSPLFPLYISYVKAQISYTLGINTQLKVEDLETVRKNIVSHKDYHFISPMTHQKSDNLFKITLMVGLSIAVITTAVMLTLCLAPGTAASMASAAAQLASKTPGFLALATTLVLTPTLIGTSSTAAVLRYKMPPTPMPQDDLIVTAKYARLNNFEI